MTAAQRLRAELAATIEDVRVLDAIASVPRDVFVPPSLRHLAWLNRALPIEEGQTISQPYVVARMCELLALNPDDRVLDVGTGSGYHAAVLSRLCRWVWSIERRPSLSASAAENLSAAGIENVTLLVGDGSAGHPAEAPYDAINVAAAAATGIPPALQRQLAPGGRVVIPVADHDERLVVAQRFDGDIAQRPLERVRFVPLVSESTTSERSIT